LVVFVVIVGDEVMLTLSFLCCVVGRKKNEKKRKKGESKEKRDLHLL